MLTTADLETLSSPYDVTPSLIEFYEENGYARLPGLIPPETAAVLYDRFSDLYEELRKREDAGQTYFDNARYHRQHRISNDPSRVDDAFLEVTRSPRVVSAARALLGTDRAVFLRAAIFEKPPATEESLPTTIHQDYPYLPFDRSGSVQIWIALHQLPGSSGTLRFVSGSHRRYGVIGRTNVLEEEQELLAKKYGIFPLTDAQPMEAGDATAHHDLTLHGADANEWTEARRGLTITYFSPEAKYNGAPYWVTDDESLEVNQVIRAERFPLL